METKGREVALSRAQRFIVRAIAPRDEMPDILDDLGEEAAEIAGARDARAARQWVRWQIANSAWPWIARRARESASRLRKEAVMIHRGVASDIRIAARRLIHARSFTPLAVLTLGIGIGAISAVFSLAHALWLKPLPYHDPDQLVWIHARHESSGATGSLTPVELAEHQRQPRALTGIAGFNYGAAIARVSGEPVRIVAHHISPNLFRVLGVHPAIGRDFVDADALPGTHLLMLSHGFWTRRFGRDLAITGKTMTLDGVTYSIAGVMPPGFVFPRGFEAEVWMPVGFTSREYADQRLVQAVARLAPGRTLADAAAEAEANVARLAAVSPQTNDRWVAYVTPASITASSTSRLAFQVLLGLVGLFLLIACTNLAGLLLARNAARRTELALYLSIGASRWRLARMLLIESTLLTSAGCIVGVLLASYSVRALSTLMPPRMPGLDDVSVNGTVVAASVLISMLAAMLIGLLPALSLRSMKPSEALSGYRTVVRGMLRAQRALVVVEIALALVLVVGASVMLRTFLQMYERDRGFDPRGLLALNVSLPFSDDSYLQTETRARVFDEMLERVRAVPGVRFAAAATGFPGSALGILGRAPVTTSGGRPTIMAAVHAASVDYFRTMGIPIKAGRDFSRSDTTRAPGVAIVNELLAREFPDGNPIGHRIPVSAAGESRSFEIVGVAGNIDLSGQPGYRLFVPLAQASPYWIDLVVRGDGNESLLMAIRQALRSMSSELLLENESSFAAIISDSLALQRVQSGFAVIVGSLSAIVAGVGLYALMTFIAVQRRRELGIRLALGSLPRRLFRDTMSKALRLVALGVILGVIASLVLIRALSAQVFGLTSVDAAAYAGAAALVLIVSIIAVWIPARRVMRTDPLVALRSD